MGLLGTGLGPEKWGIFFSNIIIIIIIYLPRTHTTQRARRTNSIRQVRQG